VDKIRDQPINTRNLVSLFSGNSLIVATRCHILRLKCRKFDSRRLSVRLLDVVQCGSTVPTGTSFNKRRTFGFRTDGVWSQAVTLCSFGGRTHLPLCAFRSWPFLSILRRLVHQPVTVYCVYTHHGLIYMHAGCCLPSQARN